MTSAFSRGGLPPTPVVRPALPCPHDDGVALAATTNKCFRRVRDPSVSRADADLSCLELQLVSQKLDSRASTHNRLPSNNLQAVLSSAARPGTSRCTRDFTRLRKITHPGPGRPQPPASAKTATPRFRACVTYTRSRLSIDSSLGTIRFSRPSPR